MLLADATSRAPVQEAKDTIDEVTNNCLEVMSVSSDCNGVAAMQYGDQRLAEMISILKLTPANRILQEEERVKQYSLRDNLLYRAVGKGEEVKYLWEIPSSMRKSIVVN